MTESFRGPAVLTALAATFLFVASSAVFAQGTSEERSACMGNAFQFCSSVIPNVPEIEACLKSNIRQLSPECRAEFEPTYATRMRPEHFQ